MGDPFMGAPIFRRVTGNTGVRSCQVFRACFRQWQTPDFKKLIYDNAMLSRVYLHVYLVTGDSFYRRIVEETLDYVAREMVSPEGGFYSTQDADSEGVEGKFFTWTPAEIEAIVPG